MRKLVTPLALAAALSLAAPAEAAPVSATPPAQARGLILIPLTLTKLEDLHFGAIIPSASSGVVVVPADGSAPSGFGGVTLVASDPAHRAQFAGAGTPSRTVIINTTNPGTLSNGLGDTVTVLALTLDGPSNRTIDATRAFSFHVGGILMVAANQPEGLYSTEFDVTADYL